MSEEFSMLVTFEVSSQKHMNDLETLLEHLDLYEHTEANELLEGYSLNQAMAQFENITSEQCHYQADCNLVEMYTETFDENVNDLDIEMDKSGFKGKVLVEGADQEALDFCAALILLLLAMDATNICGQARCDYWHGQWTKNYQEKLEFKLSIFKGDL